MEELSLVERLATPQNVGVVALLIVLYWVVSLLKNFIDKFGPLTEAVSELTGTVKGIFKE